MFFRILAWLVSNAQFDRIEIEFLGKLIHGAFQRHQPDRLTRSPHRRRHRNVQWCQTVPRQPIRSGIERTGLQRGTLVGLLAAQIAGENIVADRDEVFVPGDESAQDSVDVELKGSRMHIDLPGGWKFWKGGNGALVEVRVRHLNKLTLSGSNDVVAPGPITGDQLTVSMAGSGLARFDQLQVGSLNFEISGAGEGQLMGKVDQLRLNVSGKGKIGAEQLRTGSADVSISGVGNASLWALSDLRVQISGAGHVDYWGQPKVQKSISGFGSVDARGDKK